MHRSLLPLLAFPTILHAAPFPDRQSFAAYPHPPGQVPLSAFELFEENTADLKMEVWAESPLIFSPVAMDVDAKGRIWATEGIDYHVAPRIDAGQSIIVLTDTDNDGRADESHVFVTEKNARQAPLGIAVFDNKIVLSATPSITVYTDVDRDARFSPAIDKKEVFLTGFQNKQHDHTLHAVVGAPSGQWYFSYGNCGADIKTVDDRHLVSGCYYGYPEAIGKPSSDGHVYVGGVAARINPDGTGLTPVGHNMRNPHDMFVSATGDVFQVDNDDPAHCRFSWVMEGANFGYADLRDGSRSWEEVAKTWEEPAGWTRDLRYSRSHWRENYPGSHPPGTVYGAGSPTGNVLIEGDELGEKYRGLYLFCDMVRKEVMGAYPEPDDAQIEMGPHHPFVALKKEQRGQHFLPTDLVLGLDGSLFLSDFYNDTSRRTNQVTGTIYRISKRSETKPAAPTIDFTSTPGLLAALTSPAVNIRSEAARRLVALGRDALPATKAFYQNATGPVLRHRATWVIAQLGKPGQAYVRTQLSSADHQTRLVAFRALRLAAPDTVLTYAKKLATDPSPAIRREVAVALRDHPFDTCRDILAKLVPRYDGRNRHVLEALGTASTKKETQVYNHIVRPLFAKTPHAEWDDRAKNLAWRLHTPEAIEDLDEVIRSQKPDLAEFRHLAMAYASFRNDSDRLDRRKKLTELAALPAFAGEDYQITVDEILTKDLNDLKGELLRTSYLVPRTFGNQTELSDIPTIAALKPDPKAGQQKAQLCISCHKIKGTGVAFGPDLTHWGQQRTVPEIVAELLDPSAKLAHGYDKPVRLTAGSHVAEGLLANYSHHAGSLRLKIFGGQTKKILFRRSGARVDHLKDHSWMPPASAMGLTDQDVRNIAEYLKTL